MSLKAELETQAAALKAYDDQDFEKALQIYETIADTSKIHTNIGLILATLGEHEAAVDSFNAATELDKYLAVAYFQCGVSNFLLGRFEYALKDFEEALLYLRGNNDINYEQLGLKFKLHAAEVFFNKGLCYMYLGDEATGMQDMLEAQRCKAIPEHSVIDEAIRDKGEEYTVFSIPVGVLFRPSETKLRNAKTKDYLGKAKLISAADSRDEFTTFTGVTRLKQGQLPSGAPLEDARMPLSFSGQAARGLTRSSSANAVPSNPPSMMDKDLPRPASDGNAPGIGRSMTMGSPNTGPGSGMTRGLSLRYQKMGGDAAGAGAPVPMNGNANGGTAPLTRKMTQINVRERNEPPSPPQQQAPPAPPAASRAPQLPTQTLGAGTRLTEIYDDYYGGGGGGEEEPLPPNAADRVAQWASKTTPGTPPTGSPSPPRANGPSGNDRLRQNIGVEVRRNNTMNGNGNASDARSNGSSMRRKPSRKPSNGGNLSRAPSSYVTRSQDRSTVYDEDEEEGYFSGEYDYDDMRLTKLRVKIHFEDDIRGMTLLPDLAYDVFLDKVCAKFNRTASSLVIKFADEEGNKVSLMDDSDFDLAMELARDTAKGKGEGKLELWCTAR